jgi:hypothetical protein
MSNSPTGHRTTDDENNDNDTDEEHSEDQYLGNQNQIHTFLGGELLLSDDEDESEELYESAASQESMGSTLSSIGEERSFDINLPSVGCCFNCVSSFDSFTNGGFLAAP